MLSIIIPTKNEKRNISACIAAVRWAVVDGSAEIIVVDNSSDDDTATIAKDAGARVVTYGPERSAQRNLGGLKEACGEYLLFLDADMIVKRETLKEIIEATTSPGAPDAMFVKEEIPGSGYWNRVRNFERSFYNATCVDALRVIKRSLFVEAGGYDECLCGPEDWDLDRRILSRTDRVSLTEGALIHNEGQFSLLRNLRKKRYYSSAMPAYRKKWGNDQIIRKQLGLWYRFFGVFVENGKWRRAVRRPDLLICVWAYRVMIGFAYILRKS